MTVVHDGSNIPTVDPKDPDSDSWYEFTLALQAGETLNSIAWLINGTLVNDTDTVDGLQFVTSDVSGEAFRAKLSGGTLNQFYVLTVRYSTNQQPSEDRSMRFRVINL